MRAMFLCLCAERNHDDGRAVEEPLGFGPWERRDPDAATGVGAIGALLRFQWTDE